jgi:hypothetical protein
MIVTDEHGDWVTVAEAAHHYRIQPATVRQWVHRYRIPTVKLDGRLLLDDLALAACDKARRDTRKGRTGHRR